MSDRAFQSLKKFSPKAAAYLQLCRDGKIEQYGRQLARQTIYGPDNRFHFEVEDVDELEGEIEAYYEIGLESMARTSLERWRIGQDEADAEIVFRYYRWLDPRPSHGELMRAWHDASPKMARDLLDNMEKETDGEQLSRFLHELRLLTIDIPAETGQDFPYNKVLLGWPGGGNERSVRAHIQAQLLRLIGFFQDPAFPPTPYDGLTEHISEKYYSLVKLRAEEWGFALQDLRISESEIHRIEQYLS